MSGDDYGGLKMVTSGNTVTGRFCRIAIPGTSTISWTGTSAAFQNATSLVVTPPFEIKGDFATVTCVSGGPIIVYS